MIGGSGGQSAGSRRGGGGGRHLDVGGTAVACHQPAARVRGGRWHLHVVGGGGGQANAAIGRAHLFVVVDNEFKILIVRELFSKHSQVTSRQQPFEELQDAKPPASDPPLVPFVKTIRQLPNQLYIANGRYAICIHRPLKIYVGESKMLTPAIN